jgi:hypothetical protein
MRIDRRSAGVLSSAALAASGGAIAADPNRALRVLGLSPTSARGRAETRAGLGGTFAALGAWAVARQSTDAFTAVGVTWLGAAALRLVALTVDDPEADWSYWAFLAAEIAFGVSGIAATAVE